MSETWGIEIPKTFDDDEVGVLAENNCAFRIFDFRFTALSSAKDADPIYLTETERNRAEKFHHRIDRNRFVVGRSILRQTLGQVIKMPPADVPIELDKGRPYLGLTVSPPLFFNLSHSGSSVMLILSRKRQVGIDVEAIRDFPDMDQVANRVMSEDEFDEYIRMEPTRRSDAFYRLWVRKESILKCLGTGFEIEPRRINIGHDTSSSTESSFEGQLFQLQQFVENEYDKPHYWAFAFAGQCTQIQVERYPVVTRFV